MRRYYSHYMYIYPDIYLKNYIVEMTDDLRILRVFPYDREIEKTEFYSGWLAFVPEGKIIKCDFLSEFIEFPQYQNKLIFQSDFFRVWHKESDEVCLLK